MADVVGTLDNILAHWELEEASGTRVDSASTHDLTDNNTVGQGTGKQGNCADFESTNSEDLEKTTAIGAATDTDISVSFWYKPESIGAYQGIFITGSGTAGFFVRVENDGKLFAQYANSAGETKTRSDAVQFSAGNWYHVVVACDVSADAFDFYVNGSSVAETVFATAASGITDGTYIRLGSSAGAQFVDGLLDEVTVTNDIITSGEVTTLYNSGNGIPYSEGGTTFVPKMMSF